jgi:CubicO group peptidase (beta-lactamase class C family)
MSKIPEAMIEKLENSITSLMVEMKIPGVSLGVLHGDDLIYQRAFGARCLEGNLPATLDTLWSIGSISKSYCAVAIMQLAEQDKLNVHDPVNKHVPFKLEGLGGIPITIHHLLTHTSGFPNLGIVDLVFNRWGIHSKNVNPISSWDDFFLLINGAKNELVAEPGKKCIYFNEGYNILQAIVEKVSGTKYDDYIKEKILNPLKMNRSTFSKEEFEKDPDHFTGYTPSSEIAPHPFDEQIYATAGLISSVREQLNYLKIYLNGGVFEGNKILDSNSIEEMIKNHVKSDLASNYMAGDWKEYYGYGWVILDEVQGHRLIGHLGSTGFGASGVVFIQEKKIAVAMSCNAGSGQGLCFFIPLTIILSLLGKDPEKTLTIVQKQQRMVNLTGYYDTYKGLNKAKVEMRRNMLYIITTDEVAQAMGQAPTPTPLIPETKTMNDLNFYIYTAPGATIPVEFKFDESGNVNFFLERDLYHKISEIPPTE